MGGMKYVVLLALTVATVSALNDYTDGCTKPCPVCQINNDFTEAIPSDVCSYCHCAKGAIQSIEHCPLGQEYHPDDGCVPSTRCGGDIDPRCYADDLQYCGDCYHDMDTKFPSTNPCGYCQCTGDGNMEYHDCPHGTGWENYQCKPTDKCCADECAHVTCPPCYHGMFLRFPDPFDDCKFCCCEPIGDNTTHEHGVPKDCPPDMIFSVEENQCVWTSNRVCNRRDPCPTPPPTHPPIPTVPTCPPPPKPCDVTCPKAHYGQNWLMPNPLDQCSFCCCKPDGTGQEIPHLKSCLRNDEYFDPADKRCKKSQHGECPAPPPPPGPTDCHYPGNRDGCFLVIDMCKYDADGHLPNPYEDASFCQCDFDRIHWMPCAGGTTRYDDDAGACI